MSEKNNAVSKLVPLPREVEFDDTLREFNAILRMDAKIEEDDVKIQLLIDFRHKKNMRLSKPRFYGTISQPRQFENLVSGAFTVATFHRLRRKEKITREDIEVVVDEMFKWIKEDVVVLTQVLFRDVQKRK